MGHAFDLNVEKVLEHWSPAHAFREAIANALDEHIIIRHHQLPEIAKDDCGVWHLRDRGRGLRYQHLTQNESDEKRSHDGVVGQFGVGLKDALATFHRAQIGVRIRSRHGDISLVKKAKHGFGDLLTLHAVIEPPTDPDMVGTDVALDGLADGSVDDAKSFFLAYDDDALVLDTSPHGQVLKRPRGEAAHVYVRGVRVSEDEGLLFSYNITKLDAKLRKAMNRERSNVGRSAYSDRLKAILLNVQDATVLTGLVQDMEGFAAGSTQDEVKWNDVAQRVVQQLSTTDPDTVFVTAAQRWSHPDLIQRAQSEGKRVFVVPDALAARLGDDTNQAVTTLDRFSDDWNSRVMIEPIDPTRLHTAERALFDTAGGVLRLAGLRSNQWNVVISETLHLTPDGKETAHGLWQPELGRIVINRKCLASPELFIGTLLHEVTHAATGAPDVSSEFEEGLTDMLGTVGVKAL